MQSLFIEIYQGSGVDAFDPCEFENELTSYSQVSKLALDPQAIGRVIGILPAKWNGRCHEVASLILDNGIIEGELCYGIYHGKISEDSTWSFCGGRKNLVRHGWILLKSGAIYDPTRWCFFGYHPAIYVGPDTDYDHGANQLKQTLGICTPPAAGKTDIIVRMSGDKAKNVCSLLGIPHTNEIPMSYAQCGWLCSRPLQTISNFAADLYTQVIALGHKVLIPIDNRYIIKE
jgi:hypothetical protein